MAWRCIHCGTDIGSNDSLVCPNCEENPFEGGKNPFKKDKNRSKKDGEFEDLLQIDPKVSKEFFATGKISKQKKTKKSKPLG